MAKVSRRDGRKEKFWRQLLRQWRQSGLGVREFCACEGVSEPSFYAWRRELAERDDRDQQARSPGSEAAKPAPRQPMFVPVRVQQPTGQAGAANDARHEPAQDIEVVLPDGIRLRLAAQFDAAALQRVLGVLSGLNGASMISTARPPAQSGGESC